MSLHAEAPNSLHFADDISKHIFLNEILNFKYNFMEFYSLWAN